MPREYTTDLKGLTQGWRGRGLTEIEENTKAIQVDATIAVAERLEALVEVLDWRLGVIQGLLPYAGGRADKKGG